jgi:CRISPR-associated protein Cas1
MLNEYVYCPRLFYLEWVDDRWASNDDTAEGSFAHRAVDRSEGALPPPELADIIRRVQSVRLESRELGLVAVIDRVEGDRGEVVPIDIKKGRPRDDGTPWPADRAQMLVHAVLLREHGYRVSRALIYYAQVHQRVEIDIGQEAQSEVSELVEGARAVAESGSAPLPLVHSPKCPRCSLVGLCLPDETNALLARAEQPPRRIVPRDPAPRPLYVTEQGAFVGIRGGRVRVTKGDSVLADLRAIDVSQLAVHGNVQVSTQALADLWARGLPVLWFTYGGWLRGWAQGEPSRYVELRRRQVATHAQGALPIAMAMVEGKIRNCRTLLRRNARQDLGSAYSALAGLGRAAQSATGFPELLGIEGTAARIYFDRFPLMISSAQTHLAQDFATEGRRRRPAPDPVNALLGYCYSLLLKDIVAVCLGVGLDPYLGVYHRPRYGRPALALDLMEEFRPLIADSVVINLINNGEVGTTDFVQRGSAAWLTPNGRKTVIRAYERRLDHSITHPLFKYRISYRRVLDVQARLLAAVFVGELDRYTPMMTR